jgi:hypothetical protein
VIVAAADVAAQVPQPAGEGQEIVRRGDLGHMEAGDVTNVGADRSLSVTCR